MLNKNNEVSLTSAAILAVSAIAIVAGLFGSWYTIDQGERGVLLRNGAVVGVADAGLGFKLPFIDSVRRISLQSKAAQYEHVLSYSRDQQSADLSLSVSYRLPADQVASIYAEYGGEGGIVSRLLDRQLPAAAKSVFGQYNAVTAIQERARMSVDMTSALQKMVKGPIIIESVQIENIDFSDAYEAAIEARMKAEVDVQRIRQNAEREKIQAEIVVIQAKANAESTLAQAQAQAEAVRLNGAAQADAIRARAEALGSNPSLIELTQAERWNGVLPATMVPSGGVPFISVK